MYKILLVCLAAFSFFAPQARAQGVEAEVDLFELHAGKGDEHFVFDSTFTAGGDLHGVALKVEGGSDVGPRIDDVTAQLLYTFAPAEGTSLLAGVRRDFRGGADMNYATLVIVQDFGELLSAEHFLYLSEHGDLTGAAQVVASLPLGPALQIEPRAAMGWAAREIPAEETGSGITDVELSLRLRQAIGPVLNVYIGAIHERLVGGTADIAIANGDRSHVTRAVFGAGFSF